MRKNEVCRWETRPFWVHKRLGPRPPHPLVASTTSLGPCVSVLCPLRLSGSALPCSPAPVGLVTDREGGVWGPGGCSGRRPQRRPGRRATERRRAARSAGAGGLPRTQRDVVCPCALPLRRDTPGAGGGGGFRRALTRQPHGVQWNSMEFIGIYKVLLPSSNCQLFNQCINFESSCLVSRCVVGVYVHLSNGECCLDTHVFPSHALRISVRHVPLFIRRPHRGIGTAVPHRRRRGGYPPPCSPSPPDQRGRTIVHRWGNLMGPFVVHKLLGPIPPPPPFLIFPWMAPHPMPTHTHVHTHPHTDTHTHIVCPSGPPCRGEHRAHGLQRW